MTDVDDEVCDKWENFHFKWKNTFLKTLGLLCEYVGSNVIVNESEYGLENNRSRERTQQTTDKYETGALRKTTTIDDKLNKPVVKLAPLFYESSFRKKTGPAMLASVNCTMKNSTSNVTDETYNSKLLNIV